MAEFCEVAKQFQRMCDSYPDDCSGCAFRDIHIDAGHVCFAHVLNNPGITEPLILKWAEAHPEPRYPTWIEWQKSIYPEADEPMCPGKLCAEANRRCTSSLCPDCRNRPIPADVAEKLGIKPIE